MIRTRAGRQHLDLVNEAGFGRLSGISVMAGVVTAYGTFAIVASIVGALLSAVDVDTEFRSNDWAGSGAVAALATAMTLLLAYLFGGYVAGRMGRRAGVLHGLGVFVLSLVIAAALSAAVAAIADDEQLRSNLRGVGIPTSMDQITGVAVTGVLVSIAAMLVGSVAGAMLGEHWHTRLARRAIDPTIGPAAEHRRQAATLDATREDRIGEELAAEGERFEPGRERIAPHDTNAAPEVAADGGGPAPRPLTAAVPPPGDRAGE